MQLIEITVIGHEAIAATPAVFSISHLPHLYNSSYKILTNFIQILINKDPGFVLV